MTKDLVGKENYEAYIKMLPELKKKYIGNYVAFIDGKIAGIEREYDLLVEKMYKEYDRTDFLTQLIEEDDNVIVIHRPSNMNETEDV